MTLGDRIIDRALLLQLGTYVVGVIKQRTLRGEFLPGSTGSSEYSTTPMPLPLVRLQKAVRNSTEFKALLDSGDAEVFTSKRGRKWVILQGGYKKLRELAGKSTDHVNLSWRGTMLRNLNIKSVNEAEGSVTLGFSDAESERIAGYHQEEGAGRRRVTHKFLGLTFGEEEGLVQFSALLLNKK